MRKERLTYQDLIRKMLAGRLLRLEERRRAEEILAIPDSVEMALRLGSLLAAVAERGGLIRLGRRPGDVQNIQRYLDPLTNDHWAVEVSGPSTVHPRAERRASASTTEPPTSSSPNVAPAPAAPASTPASPAAPPPEASESPAPTTPTTAAASASRPAVDATPRIVRAVEEVRVEPKVARHFVDDHTGEPLRTLFGTFSPCRTPEELGAALTPLRDQIVSLTSATEVRFFLLPDPESDLSPIPTRDTPTRPHEPLAGRVTDNVIGERRMLHVPNVAAQEAGAVPGTVGALVSVPLLSGDLLSGIMEVRRDTAGPFSEDELALFRVASLSAGGAIARAEILEKLIFLDRLTGLYNRAYFDDQIEREIERANRNGTSVALLMADLDHFKRINDNYGHQAGDLALSQLAAIMRSNIRQIDVAARYGGEEFALLLPGITRARAARTAERLRRVVADTQFGDVFPELEGVRLSISLGFALYPDDAATAKQLVDRADRVALYAAKNRGRNRVVPWSAAREPQSGVGS